MLLKNFFPKSGVVAQTVILASWGRRKEGYHEPKANLGYKVQLYLKIQNNNKTSNFKATDQ